MATTTRKFMQQRSNDNRKSILSRTTLTECQTLKRSWNQPRPKCPTSRRADIKQQNHWTAEGGVHFESNVNEAPELANQYRNHCMARQFTNKLPANPNGKAVRRAALEVFKALQATEYLE